MTFGHMGLAQLAFAVVLHTHRALGTHALMNFHPFHELKWSGDHDVIPIEMVVEKRCDELD
jgi:hypothetical protein